MPPTPELEAEREARLVKLEEKVSYQDKLIAELNEVVVSLHRLTDHLASQFRTIERALGNDLGPRDLPHEKPPHY